METDVISLSKVHRREGFNVHAVDCRLVPSETGRDVLVDGEMKPVWIGSDFDAQQSVAWKEKSRENVLLYRSVIHQS